MFLDDPILTLIVGGALILTPFLVYYAGIRMLFETNGKKNIGYLFTITGAISIIGVLVAMFFKNLTTVGFSIFGIGLLALFLIPIAIGTYKKFRRIFSGEIKFSTKPVTDLLFGDPAVAIALVIGVFMGIARGLSLWEIFWIITGSVLLISYLTFILRDN